MKVEQEELLMMFINDVHKIQSGKISQSTAIKAMRYVSQDDELRRKVSNCDYAGVLRHRTKK